MRDSSGRPGLTVIIGLKVHQKDNLYMKMFKNYFSISEGYDSLNELPAFLFLLGYSPFS